MNYQQYARYCKIETDEFYLLNHDIEMNKDRIKKTQFKISGSTKNIYTVTLNFQYKNIGCDCPDSIGRCRSQEMVCKHCCFVLFTVLKVFDKVNTKDEIVNQTDFFDELIFTNEELDKASTKIKTLFAMYGSSEFVDPELLEKFEEFMGKTPKKEKENKFQEGKKELTEEDVCPICFDDFMDETVEKVNCPLCKNYVHTACIKQWLKHGQKKCVYCRSEVWKDFGKEKGKIGKTDQGYYNLDL